ncbi:metal ABC transporter solute-binding protein, Zn/Mn family [Lactobacillus sp. ESL0230]|uniref:metal ABC transporter solute-binding protein, Zn/Mn family n=1 Tax=Lactobacillus sp. ESL0230 TaxID=2069353 RepID=UPI000EFB0567|nr:zinc ABC transporter substrate-binding protein [Lactobacillus sp. ESL0230]RMC44817.1 metal ABC transporter substrate-binding protein [Lactobacillus sp. ESL0230]
MNLFKFKKLFTLTTLLGLIVLTLTACTQTPKKNTKMTIVTTTNVYADIAKNVVGKYGTAEAIIKNPNSDPHDFEPTTNDAKKLASADIIVANGLGYDSWMNKLASSVDKKPVLVGEELLGLKKGANPHIWFDLAMPKKYVDDLVQRLSKKDPTHASYYRKNGQAYLAKIKDIQQNVNQLEQHHSKPVYVSEPVFDYALQAGNFKIANQDFEKAIQNNTDPSPATIQQMTAGIKKHKIAFFVVNSQTSSTTVSNFVRLAQKEKIPVLKVRETIPVKTTYLDWMTDNYQSLAKIAKQ